VADEPLTIMMVQLCDDSLKTTRVLNNGNPDLYPVIVYFSRRADEYERRELATSASSVRTTTACVR